MLQQLLIHGGVGFGYAHALKEVLYGFGRIAATAHTYQSRHTRVIPAVYKMLLDQTAQVAFGHDRVGDIQARKLNLARRMLETGLSHNPVIQRAVYLVFQRAQRVRYALDCVLQRMLEIIHRIDAPLVARAVMMMAQYAVQRRVAHDQVGRSHVDLGTQYVFAVREFARLHAMEQIEAFLDGAVAVRAVLAGLGQRAAVFAHLLGSKVVDVSHALFNKIARNVEQPVKEVGRIVKMRPVKAQPLYVALNGLDVLGVLFGRVGIVKTQVALAAVLFRYAEIDAQRLGVADVQVAVGFGRKARVYFVRDAARGYILIYNIFDKIGMYGAFLHGGASL